MNLNKDNNLLVIEKIIEKESKLKEESLTAINSLVGTDKVVKFNKAIVLNLSTPQSHYPLSFNHYSNGDVMFINTDKELIDYRKIDELKVSSIIELLKEIGESLMQENDYE